MGETVDIAEQVTHDQQIQRVQREGDSAVRRRLQRAGHSGRQDNYARCPQVKGRGDRRVVGNSAVHQVPTINRHRWKDGGDRSTGEQRRCDWTRGQRGFCAIQHVGGHNVAGYPGILQPLIKELRFNEESQRRGSDKMIPFPEETEDAADYREWEDIRSVQPEPDALEALDALFIGLSGIIGAVRADGGTDYEVWDDVLPGQR